jgi:GMP synthase-like glutamine amidotransferase
MRIHMLEHEVGFSLNVTDWAKKNNQPINLTDVCQMEPLPALRDFDCLIVAGGPQHAWEEEIHPWLIPEKKFIKKAVKAEKLIVGICLGAQLLAEAMGGEVFSNPHEELGWHEVTLTPEGISSAAFDKVPHRFTIFQWHSDHYSLPPGAIRLASGAVAENQAFISENRRTLGIQFHPDFNCKTIQHMVTTYNEKWPSGPFVTNRNDLIRQTGKMPEPSWLMDQLLDNFLDNGFSSGNQAFAEVD